MKNISIWNDIKRDSYPSLDKNINCDILIIGGGITGVSTLHHLQNSNLNVVLIEQNKVGTGITSNSTGKLCYLQNDLLDKIRNFYSDKIASYYLRSQIDAINDMVNTIKTENIDCDLELSKAYLYTNNDKDVSKIKDLEQFLLANNIKIDYESNNLVKSKYMIKVTDTYLINPVKLIYGLIKSNHFPIYENTCLKKIKKEDNKYVCYTDKGKITTKKVVLATHYPYFLVPFFFPLKVYLEKSYLSASKLYIKPISLISYSNPFISIRSYKDNVIYLSNSHDNNKDICDEKNFNELLKKLEDINLNPNYLWSNIDIITSDGLPYIGKLKNNILIGTGYNTWGLTNGYLAGQILADMILDKPNKYIELFNPNRKNIKHLPVYLKNIGKNIGGYVRGYTVKNRSKNICPHMGCKLVYNDVENTYDCPCHGSRFNKDGKLLSGPAKKNIK